jgi:lactoylglutathione lyase
MVQTTSDHVVIAPDGNWIEVVQWPAGHADGITAADWAE